MKTGPIVVHNASSFLGGAERWTLRLLTALQDRGHDVVFLCRDRRMVERAAGFGVEGRVARLGGQAMVPDALRFAARLRRLVPRALLLTTFKKIWLGGMGARLAGVPRVVARIGLSTDLPTRHWTYRVALRRWIDRTVVNADEIRVAFLQGIPDLDPARVITIYNGVRAPSRRGPPRCVRRELGIPDEAPVIGTLARLDVQKRLDRLLDALPHLGEGVHCLLAGEGGEQDALKDRARRLGVGDRVHLLGPREDVGDVLDALDVFVLTSDREGMSNAMLEAMAAGVPVVTTPVSGAEEALESGESDAEPGFVVPADPFAIAATLRRLLAAPGLRAAMGRAGMSRALERFDFHEKVLQWEALLAGDLAAARHEGPSPLLPAVPPPQR